MALARGAEGVGSRNHAGARELCANRQGVAVETHQIMQKQKQASDPGGEFVRRESEVMDIGHRFGIGPRQHWSLVVPPPRQGSKALLGENLAHGGRAQWRALLRERLADLMNYCPPSR